MPHFLISEPAEVILRILGEALDLVNVGILLLNRDLRTRFINQHLQDMLHISPDFWASGPTYRAILVHGQATAWFAVEPDYLPRFLDEREDDARAGSIRPTQLHLKDGRRLLFSCFGCPDGGRILTYADISEELQREASEALEAGCADMRFQNETLESPPPIWPHWPRPPMRAPARSRPRDWNSSRRWRSNGNSRPNCDGWPTSTA